MYNILKPNINKMNVYIGWQNWRSLEHFKWIQLFLRTSRDEHSLVFHVLILFLKTVSEVASFKESGVSSQIFGDNQKSLTTVICHKCPYFIYPIYLRTLAEACTFLLYPDHHEISHRCIWCKEPSVDSCGTPVRNSSKWLWEEFTFVLCFLLSK